MIAPVPPATDEDTAAIAVGPFSLEELADVAGLDAITAERLERWLRDDIELAINTAAARRKREATEDPRAQAPA